MPNPRPSFPFRWPLLILIAILTRPAAATVFIVPDDTELIDKADAIVTGVITSARGQVSGRYVESEYQFEVEETFKGSPSAGSAILITSPGGTTGTLMTRVESAAHFSAGDHVLLFLTATGNAWTPTDMTIGKFRFAQTSRGSSVLVRDAEDIVGWDRDGRVHKEPVRLREGFLQYIRHEVSRRDLTLDPQYFVEAREVLAPPASKPTRLPFASNAVPPSHTYSSRVWACDGSSYPARWDTTRMASGVVFYKNSAQNATYTSDGGVSIIQNALAGWTNDCGSLVNATYGGTNPKLVDKADLVNMVVFNDPTGLIQGSWTGSGVIARTYLNAGDVAAFDGADWALLTDTDIVVQDGFPGNHSAMNAAMTHEVGHALGLRHADRNYAAVCTVAAGCSITCSAEAACNAATQECATTAIMTAAANPALAFTPQAWDQNAARALYPGGLCVTLGSPTGLVATGDVSSVTLGWAGSTAATGYKIYRRGTGEAAATFLASSIGTTYADSAVVAGQAYIYYVTATAAAAESAASNSDFATVFRYTDTTLGSGTTTIRRSHITELRSAVDALRAVNGNGPATWTTDPLVTAGVTPVRRLHIDELRAAVNAARTALGFTSTTFAIDPTLTSNLTSIKLAHISELRDALK